MSPVKDPLVSARAGNLAAEVAERGILVCTGAGGVGKTTTAAALAVAAARQGRRTVVCTIDPAKRLAQSLGLKVLDNRPRAVTQVAGLDALMLDMKRTFDEVIERHAPDPRRAARIKANRFYQQMSDSLAGTQEYMAMEKLYDLALGGRYDCIVVDTPPTRNALDFLEAPRRLTDFLEGRFLKMFLAPGVAVGKTFGRAAAFGTSLFMRTASRVTGAAVLQDLADFFQSFEGMYDGFKDRAQAVYELLRSERSGFVIVSSAEPPALREARFFLRRLAEDDMPLAGMVVNRVTPPAPKELTALKASDVNAAIQQLTTGPEERAAAALLGLHRDRVAVHGREQRAIAAALAGIDPRVLVEIPQLASDVHDLAGLERIAERLVGPRRAGRLVAGPQ